MHQTDPTGRSMDHIYKRMIDQMFAFSEVLDSLNLLREAEVERFFELLHICLEREGCSCKLHATEKYFEEPGRIDDESVWSVIYFSRDAALFAFQHDDNGNFRVIDYAVPNPRDGRKPSRPRMLIVQ